MADEHPITIEPVAEIDKRSLQPTSPPPAYTPGGSYTPTNTKHTFAYQSLQEEHEPSTTVYVGNAEKDVSKDVSSSPKFHFMHLFFLQRIKSGLFKFEEFSMQLFFLHISLLHVFVCFVLF